MSKIYSYPKLRWPLDYRVEKIQGEEIAILSDPRGIAPEPLLLRAAFAPLISCFDGKQSVDSIVEKFAVQGLQRSLLEQLIEVLDTACLLETDRYRQREKEVLEIFKNSTVRVSSSLAPYYSEQSLYLDVDSYLEEPKSKGDTDIVGLIAPHIDYRRGGFSYGVTYGAMSDQRHDLYLIVGTGHQYSDRLFHLTKKDFEIPGGVLRTDRDFIENLAVLHGEGRSYQDEYLHKQEHSIELQLPFLLRALQEKNHNFKIAPILIGSFHQMLLEEKLPGEYEEYMSFSSSLYEVVKKYLHEGKRVCFISSVDMAHVGGAFGDRDKLTIERMKLVEEQDRVYLDAIENQNKEQLFYHMASDKNERKVCGFPTFFTMIDLFDRLGVQYSSHLFDYRQAVDYENECAVTFAGLGLYL